MASALMLSYICASSISKLGANFTAISKHLQNPNSSLWVHANTLISRDYRETPTGLLTSAQAPLVYDETQQPEYSLHT